MDSSRPITTHAYTQPMISESIIAGGTFIQHSVLAHTATSAGYEAFLRAVSPRAFHDAGHLHDPPRCHQDTRVAVIDGIMNFVSIDMKKESHVLWLSGPMGAGKTAIARTIAERCLAQSGLLASFFFGRTDPTRNNGGSLVATIAYQMMQSVPTIRRYVISSIEDDPLVLERSLLSQFTSLIIEPLRQLHSSQHRVYPRLIVLDGLDECTNEVEQRNIVEVVLSVGRTFPSLILFLICSRPEPSITSSFQTAMSSNSIRHIVLNSALEPDKDIEIFLRDRFQSFKREHTNSNLIPPSWPSNALIYSLVARSSGQFIYPATVVKYMESHRHRPDERLRAILKLRPPFQDSPFAEIDALYRHIFSAVDDMNLVHEVIACHLLYNAECSSIESFLGLDEGEIQLILAPLSSLIIVETEESKRKIRFHHASLIEFLKDGQRAKDLFLDLNVRSNNHKIKLLDYYSELHHDSLIRPGAEWILDLIFWVNPLPTNELLHSIRRFSIPTAFKRMNRANGLENRFLTRKLLPLLFSLLFKEQKNDQFNSLYLSQCHSLTDYIIAISPTWTPDCYQLHLIHSLVLLPDTARAQKLKRLVEATYIPDMASCRCCNMSHEHDFAEMLWRTRELGIPYNGIPQKIRQETYAKGLAFCFQIVCQHNLEVNSSASLIVGPTPKRTANRSETGTTFSFLYAH